MNRLLIITSLALVLLFAPAVVSCVACYAIVAMPKLEEPDSAIKTPNPAKAPWHFVLGSPLDLAASGVPRWGGTPGRWFSIWGVLAVMVLVTCASLRNYWLLVPAFVVGLGLAVPWIFAMRQILLFHWGI